MEAGPIRSRTLRDPASGRIWATRCDGPEVTVRVGPPDAARASVRRFADAEAARRWAEKQEWARLKKGMVLLDPRAPWGTPRLHRFVGGAYTGAMALAAAGDGGLYCNRFGEADEIVHVAADGIVSHGLTLPGERLAWRAAAADGALLLLVDGGVLRWSPVGGAAAPLTPYHHPPGFLSVAGEARRAAWYDAPDVVVRCLATGRDLLRYPAEPGIHGGHSRQMEGALSPDGRRLALCVRPGEVRVLDAASGRVDRCLTGDFAMVRRLAFLPDGRRLLLSEQYGRWSLRCLDVETGGPCAGWTDLHDPAIVDFAPDPAGQFLAVARRGRICVHAPGTARPPRGFAVEHVVKRCALAWVGADTLAVRTDYGCASLYAVA